MNGYVKTIVKQKAKIEKTQTTLSKLMGELESVRTKIVNDVELLEVQKQAKLKQAEDLYKQKLAQAKELLEATKNGVTQSVKTQTDELTEILKAHFSS